jgi:ATP-dependent RNA helicase DOB1
MPAKTVVFTKTRKFDGEDFRWISSGEYIQMSGRAGRRGKDDKGIVIQMLDEKMAPDVAKGMIYGASDPLHSSYHVGYNMLLNMLRVEDSDPENILRSSFYQYQREQEVPKLEEQAASLEQEAATLQIEDKEVIAEFFTLQQLKEKTNEEISRTMTKPNHCLPYLNSGRLVSIRCDNKNWGWAALISYCKGEKRTGICVGFDKVDVSAPNFYSVEVLMKVEVEVLDDGTEAIHPFSGDGEGRSEVIIVPLSAIQSISAIRMNLPKDLSKSSSRSSVMRAFTEIFNRFGKNPSSDSGNGIPCLHPVNDMAINTVEMKSLLDRQSELDNRIKGSPVNQIADKEERLTTYSKQLALLDEARKLRQQAKLTQVITMKDELRRMKRVLRRLEYISPDGVLSVKGRFSCELSAGDELVITDITFDGIFNDLTVEQSVALLSCFVHKEGQNEGGIKIQDNMTSPYQKLVSTARKIARVCIESNIDLEEEAFVKSFNPALIEVTYMWASGARFADICRVTEIFEGSIIRSLKRLEELLRQLASGALAIGNNELKTLFENGANKIRRGIVFAASLYL